MSQLNVNNNKSYESSSSLYQNPIVNTSERIKLLQHEISMVRELLEIEQDSKCM